MNLPIEPPLPKDYYVSTLDWLAHSGGNRAELLFEIYPELKIPRVARKEEKQLLNGKPKHSNKAFVAILPEGRILGDRAVISPDNKLLWDVSAEWMTTPEQHSVFSDDKLPPLTRTDETVAMLNHPAGYNYFHWMLEALARVHLIQQTGIKIDKYVINHRRLPFQLKTLAVCGIPADKIVVPDPQFHLQAKKLIVPSYVNLPNKWSTQYVRNLLLSGRVIEKKKKYERIYITRQHYRAVANEQALLGVLEKHGFRSILLESLPLSKQMKIFHSAKIVVAPHGAGLTNLVFCKPGTKVVELFSPRYLEPHYWMISRLLNLDYHFIVGKTVKLNKYWSGFDNMAIEPNELSKILRTLL